MAETMILRKLLTALVFERGGKRIELAPHSVVQLYPEEVKRIQAMNPDLLEFPSDDEVELFNLRQAKAEPLKVDTGDLADGPAAAPAAAKKAAGKKAAAKPADTATAAEGPAVATGAEGGQSGDEKHDDEI